METLLKELYFDVLRLDNKTVNVVQEEFTKFIAKAAMGISQIKNEEIEYGMFFIYYSGHGHMLDGETFGIDQNGADVPIE